MICGINSSNGAPMGSPRNAGNKIAGIGTASVRFERRFFNNVRISFVPTITMKETRKKIHSREMLIRLS